MTTTHKKTQEFGERTLAGINAELAAILQMPACDLTAGAGTSLTDDLVVCGILGGKDVGKSTLINALARQQISKTDEEVGPGTTRPVAFIHRDAAETYRTRFGPRGSEGNGIEFREHHADAIRNLVLIDMPDFDSEIPRHLDIVRAILPLLDRIIWVVTPRKSPIASGWTSFTRDSSTRTTSITC